MLKVSVKRIKAAIDEINEMGYANILVTYKAKTTKSTLTALLLSQLAGVNEAGKLDEVPADAWDTYKLVKPEPEAKITTVNYNDTEEGQADLAANRMADEKAAHKEAAKIKAADAIKKNGITAATPKPKFTKAMAFWGLLKKHPITTKPALAEALRLTHGNGSVPEAKFWTNNYLNLLVETGLVEVKDNNVTLIER